MFRVWDIVIPQTLRGNRPELQTILAKTDLILLATCMTFALTRPSVMEGAIDGHLHLRFFFIFPKPVIRFV